MKYFHINRSKFCDHLLGLDKMKVRMNILQEVSTFTVSHSQFHTYVFDMAYDCTC